MSWYEKHGYIEDPFNASKKAHVESSLNLDEPAEELAYNIEAGNMVLVEGSKGTGKTTLLFSAIERFKGEKRVIYFDCSMEAVDIKKLMQNKYGVVGRLLNMTPKGMILMLDNFKHIQRKEVDRAKFYYDNNFIRSIVFTGNGAKLPDNIVDRIGNHVIKLKKLTARDAVQLVKKRLGSLEFLPEKTIRKIYSKTKGDTEKFLQECSKACGAAADAGAEKVSEEHLNMPGEKNE